jgi:drug/metabolite transporter (DMT)-like permease
MTQRIQKPAFSLMVIIAFAIVYLVWGSTYFFIRVAIQQIPALLMAFMRFFSAGLLLLIWCAINGEKIFSKQSIRPAIWSGLFMLVIGNGAVVWSEQFLPSSFAAVIASTSPIWFVVLDGRNRSINFKSRETVVGLLIGFTGVILLFAEQAIRALTTPGNSMQNTALIVLMIGAASWAGGSLYAKYNSKGDSQSVNASWQMLSAGIAFIPLSAMSGEWKNFHWNQVGTTSWLALIYLIVFGSLIAYSAYTWLLKVKPATQVSTHAYVNPVVAVLLGTLLAGEKMTLLQFVGLAIILTSVLLINLSKYRKERKVFVNQPAVNTKVAC